MKMGAWQSLLGVQLNLYLSIKLPYLAFLTKAVVTRG